VQSLLKFLEVPPKIKTTHDQAVPLPGIYPKSPYERDPRTPVFISEPFTVDKLGKQSRYSTPENR
jgi:hypothetical protein